MEYFGIRIYTYKFYGCDKPVKVEAINKAESREILKKILEKLPAEYRESKVVGESVSIPLKGVTEKVVKGVLYVWVGEDKIKNGWMNKDEYLKIAKKIKK